MPFRVKFSFFKISGLWLMLKILTSHFFFFLTHYPRFGDSQLHYCEVMLKDIHDSKRMNAHLHSDPAFELSNKQFVATAIILSAQFWPVFKDETLELPEIVKEHLNVYTKAFETLKVSSPCRLFKRCQPFTFVFSFLSSYWVAPYFACVRFIKKNQTMLAGCITFFF